MPTAGISRVTEDSWASENYNLPCALYFYYLNDKLPDWKTELSGGILGNCPAIQSVQYVPFLDIMDMDINSVEYDTERFGSIEELRPNLTGTPLVYRVKAIVNNIKTLGSFTCYKPQKSIGGDISWKNESRLYNYPYSFAMLTDNLNPPIEIQYHLCKSNTNNVKVRSTISDRCSYGLYVDGYKNDTDGKLESMVSGDGHELPCSSSAYNQWYAGNKNQVAQNVLNESQMSFIQNAGLQKQLLPNLISQVTFNPANMIQAGAGMVSGVIQNQTQQQLNNQSVQNAVASAMATSKDLKNTPNTMLSMGSDVYYGLDKGEKKVSLYRFGLTNDYYKRLGDYFAMYGYKQNKVMNINTRSRNYYNYIKTIGVNLKSKGVPRNYLEEIKSIYNKGVTIWHVDRENFRSVGDYSKDNYEV